MTKTSFRVCSTLVLGGALTASLAGSSCTAEEEPGNLERTELRSGDCGGGGYDDGDDDGHDDGHDDGYDDGHDDGHDDGYDDGHDDGYDDGHDDGHDDGGHHDTCEIETQDVELWPPNHQMVDIDVLEDCITELKDCGHDCEVEILWVTSDEPVNDQGDGNTDPDIVCVDDDTVQVRRERAGGGDGRVYKIKFKVECDDDHGHGHGHGHGGHDHDDHEAFGICKVTVPHDQGQGDEAVNSGPAYPAVDCRD